MRRALREEIWRDLVDDLVRLGLPATTRAERERVEMIAEAIIAQTEALALAFLDGRYSNLEAVVGVLTEFAVGMLGLEPRGPERRARGRPARLRRR